MTSLYIQYKQTLGNTDFDISITLPSSGITAIFGRSGAGKTSLINAVAGLTKPKSGRISIGSHLLFDSSNGFYLPTHQRNIGYVFQDARLFPHYKVKGNLLYGVRDFNQDYFGKMVDMLSLQHLLTRYPSELSGGEKQRVAIGRALLSEPDLLLMDEPLASLDIPRKREVMPFLERLAAQVEIPILYVSHSVQEVLRLAHYLVIIDQGHVATSGPIQKVWASKEMRPWLEDQEQSSLFVGQLVEQCETYQLSKVMLTAEQYLWVQKIGSANNSSVRIQIRANDVSIVLSKPKQTSIRNILQAKICSVVSGSDHSTYRFNVLVKLQLGQDCFLWAAVTRWAFDELKLEEGQQVFAQIKGVSVTQNDIALNH
ncbi:molybdenum ABC transporter ATP-binding protein ModC [Vibrio sp. S4M6]|uniref:molybdenum ABC transporter ATP-binding protein ModC n=1 Tax=Vibrio sinus TaxID=2946865 RepID=UPI00202A8AC7|nr:molybdenum ABC transporter ATP-binding protein ModC [Vibrio sinus]MCL9779843.1 molybdenum ABC transporter ATP-binding protein ModC [Vibrio sinus]